MMQQKRNGIGLDLGGTALKYALCNSNGKVLHEGKRPSYAQESPQIIIKNMAEAVEELKTTAAAENVVPEVVGLGTPGSVDVNRGYLMGSTPNFKYWKDIHVSAELSDLVKLPVFVDNDANLMAMGESAFGAGREYNDIICLTVGTGIGGGIIINGELYRGARFAGAELGHCTIVADGLACNCGGNGCLEQYASATSIIRRYKEYSQEARIKPAEEDADVRFIFEQYRKNDPFAQRAINEAIYYLGRGVASFINIFNPQIVIIGGGVADAGSLFIDGVREVATKYAMRISMQDVKIVAASLGNSAGYFGAVAFAFEQLSKARASAK